MSDPLAKRPRAIGLQSTAPPPSISGVTVWVLVRTSDIEYRVKWECSANSEVVGTYASKALAEKAKKIESRHMDSNDGVNFHCGECWYTSLVIHETTIQDSVCDDDDDDDDDNDDDGDDEDEDYGDSDEDDDGGHEVIVVPDDD
jgi:hypothetical protein